MAGEQYTSPQNPELPLNQSRPNARGEYPQQVVDRVVNGAAGELPKSTPSPEVLAAVARAVGQSLQQHHDGAIPTENR